MAFVLAFAASTYSYPLCQHEKTCDVILKAFCIYVTEWFCKSLEISFRIKSERDSKAISFYDIPKAAYDR